MQSLQGLLFSFCSALVNDSNVGEMESCHHHDGRHRATHSVWTMGQLTRPFCRFVDKISLCRGCDLEYLYQFVNYSCGPFIHAM